MSDLNTLTYSRRWTSAEDFPRFSYTKDWNSADDFPTIETDETQVRADMQCLYDEVRDYINGALRTFLVNFGVPGSVREAANPATMLPLTIGTEWIADPAGGWSQAVTAAGATISGNTRLDLRGGAALRASLAAAGVTALWIENTAGTLTARCLGAIPPAELTVTAELFETQPASGVLNGTVYGDALGGGGAGAAVATGSVSLPIAASDTLGAVRPVAKTSAMTQAVGVDSAGRLWTAPLNAVNVAQTGQ